LCSLPNGVRVFNASRVDVGICSAVEVKEKYITWLTENLIKEIPA
jgi:hypothetical protein